MKIITACAYYGVLGHEKEAVIKGIEIEGIYDTIEISLPDDWEVSENAYGDALIRMPGSSYFWLIDELFQMDVHDGLWAVWGNESGEHRRKISWRKK